MKKIILFFILLPFLGLGQVQIGQDIDGESEDDQCGKAVAISGNGNIIAIASENGDGLNDNLTGHVRIYENIEGIWTQIGENIDGENGGDKFGSSVSLSYDGTIVAIGSKYNHDTGVFAGNARIFENIEGVWTQIGENINAEAEGDNFGQSISLSSDGTIVAIGARSGYVRIYENIEGIWTQIGENIYGDEFVNQFGMSVSLSSDGTIVAVGSISSITPEGLITGSASLFENIGGVWTQIGENIYGDTSGDKFGQSVSLSSNGTIVAVGAPQGGVQFGSERGYAKIYKNIGSIWTQIGQKIEGENFIGNSGQSVSLSSDGTIIAIGAYNNNPNSNGNNGHVRIFINQEGFWTQVGEDIDGLATGDVSGYSVSISASGETVIIGAPEFMGFPTNDPEHGYARIFTVASELALLEVIEDIAGNSNGVNVTAEQLNSIIGVSGAIEGINYTTALGNGTFVDETNPTAAEIQLIIDQVNETLGVNNVELLGFKLYPNPAKTQFTIELNSSSILESVSVYNTLGQVVLISEESTVNTSNLATGSYIVEVLTNKGKSSKKLIIE